MELKKVQKQGRDERTQEDYPTPAKIRSRCRGVFFVLFHLCLVSVPFSAPSLLKIKFYRNFFPSFCSFFVGFLNQLLIRMTNVLLCGRRMHFGMETNTLVLETNALNTRVRTSATHTQLTTRDFQTDLESRWLLLTSTHLRKRAVSRSRTHLRVYATSTSCTCTVYTQ